MPAHEAGQHEDLPGVERHILAKHRFRGPVLVKLLQQFRDLSQVAQSFAWQRPR